MPLSNYKIRELETFAHKLNAEPDKLLDTLISFVFAESKPAQLTPKEKVESIEQEALNKGWKKEQLWNINKYQRTDLHGLIYFVTDNTEITEVAEKYIALKHIIDKSGNYTVLKLYNSKVTQEWITEVVK